MAAPTLARLLTALNSDIVQEAAAADRYLGLARFVNQCRNSQVCHQIAVCAATALSNATALAVQVMTLGGSPPAFPLAQLNPLPTAGSAEEHLIDARAELAHYRGRLALARRLGLLGLQEVLQDIVLSKTRHLAHASVIASACIMRRGATTNRERNDANRSADQRWNNCF